MKRIYLTLGLMAAMTAGAFAQKNVDIQVTSIYAPQNGAMLPNLNNGDSMLVAAIVKNLGPDAIVAGDSIRFNVFGEGVATNGTDDYTLYTTNTGVALAANESDTLGFWLKQGDDYGSGVTTQLPSNALDTFIIYVYGKGADGTAFTDPGYDASLAAEDRLDPAGNNVLATTMTFGDPNGITDLFKNNNQSLNVYPNPANDGSIHFKYDFASATQAVARVTDISGRVVLTQDFGKVSGAQAFTLNVAALNAGLYMIELTTDKGKAVSKFSIQD